VDVIVLFIGNVNQQLLSCSEKRLPGLLTFCVIIMPIYIVLLYLKQEQEVKVI